MNSDSLIEEEIEERMWDALENVFPETFEDSEKIEDDLLGTLYWDDISKSWASEIELSPDHEVEVTLDPLDGEVELLIQRARTFIDDIQELNVNIRRAAAESELLELYNQTWNHGEPIDCSTFIEHLVLQSVNFKPNGTTLYYDDDDLFMTHVVVITVDFNWRMMDAYLAG